ncbi:hypothetical protein FOB97_24915 (plasmid) [Shigella flexneri]|nr:hypothetical protein [Shigella flexneri]QKW72388.1 hypothetical protein FOB97_24915 [Shigella flexneri]
MMRTATVMSLNVLWAAEKYRASHAFTTKRREITAMVKLAASTLYQRT